MLQQAICNGKRRYCKAAAARKQFGGGEGAGFGSQGLEKISLTMVGQQRIV